MDNESLGQGKSTKGFVTKEDVARLKTYDISDRMPDASFQIPDAGQPDTRFQKNLRGLGKSGKDVLEITPVEERSPVYDYNKNNILLFPSTFFVYFLVTKNGQQIPASSHKYEGIRH